MNNNESVIWNQISLSEIVKSILETDVTENCACMLCRFRW